MENTCSNKEEDAPNWVGRFWGKVDRPGGDDACWLWTGCTVQGYGRIKITGGRQADAHRLAYELTNGPVSPGMVIGHTCGHKACCNPAHLMEWTIVDQNRERDARGRGAKGEKNASSHLTDDQVRAIREAREAGTESVSSLACRYDISENSIRSIVQGRTWRHLLP